MPFSFDLKRREPPVSGKSIYDKGVYPPEFNSEFKNYIRKRDNYKCALCAKSERQVGHHLDVHHLNYTKYTVKVNCICLCRECHNMVHSDRSSSFRHEWATKFYRMTCEREGLHTVEQISEAWRRPDARER